MQTEISFPADDEVTLPGVLTVPDPADGPGPLHAEYHADSAEHAHRRIVAFFREHL